MNGKASSSEWRSARARKAGKASAATYARRRHAKGETFKTKGDAYQAGYRAGYARGSSWDRGEQAKARRG
jgi:hypothetical protein